MATNGDTNVASRGGEGGPALATAQRHKRYCKKGAFEPPPISIISAVMNRECIEQNVSPGGSASL
ncbi:triphosphoribosyl-dephospho-CoA synthase [Escherichia coli]